MASGHGQSCNILAIQAEDDTNSSTNRSRVSELYVPFGVVSYQGCSNYNAPLTVCLLYLCPLQLSRSRSLATVIDDPLAQKVEMTNWEKVWLLYALECTLRLFHSCSSDRTLMRLHRVITLITSTCLPLYATRLGFY